MPKPVIKIKSPRRDNIRDGIKGQFITKQNSSQENSSVKLGPIGFTGLNSINGRILEQSRIDLRWPNANKTYKQMSLDPTIKGANNAIDVAIGKIDWEFVAPKGNEKEEVIRATEFLNFCMKNMERQTWADFINEVGSYRTFGYHITEKVYKKVRKGKFSGKIKWKKLATRSQDTVYKWLWSKDGRELAGVQQNLSQISNESQSRFGSNVQTTIDIPINKVLLFRYDPKRDNPEGQSPLLGCYIPWNYKKLVEEYESIGVAKDLGGTPVVGISVDYLIKASTDPASEQAKVVETLTKNAANLHAGEQSYIIKPLAFNDKGNELFSFDLLGVDGGGKQYNTDDIIKRKQNEILMIYLADVLKLGSDSHGSFALADAKNNLLALAIEHHLKLIKRIIDEDLIPQTLALNGWFFEDEDMPKVSFGDIEDRNLDELGKFIQRTVSVGAMEVDENLSEDLRRVSKLKIVDRDKPLSEEMTTSSRSRAGEGEGTSGTGDSQDSGDANLENK